MKEVPIKTLKDLHFACNRFDKYDESTLKEEFLNTFWEMFSCNIEYIMLLDDTEYAEYLEFINEGGEKIGFT